MDKHPRSPEVILALAQLYDEHLDQPLKALFYYDEYLENPPGGADLELIKNSRELVYARLGRTFERENRRISALQEENTELRRQNNALKAYIGQIRKKAGSARKETKKSSRNSR